MNGDAGVGHDRFRTRGRDFQKFSRLIDDFVADVIQISALRFVDHFLIRQRRLCSWVPINHSPAAIDQILLVKIDKDFGNGARVRFVQGVALARPIARAAESFQLLNNDAAVFVLPFEHALQKFLAAKIVSRHAFVFAEPLFDRCLRANSSVIHPG